MPGLPEGWLLSPTDVDPYSVHRFTLAIKQRPEGKGSQRGEERNKKKRRGLKED